MDEALHNEQDAIPAGGVSAITTSGGVSAITTSLKELLGEPNEDDSDFETWLRQHDKCSPGIMALKCGLDDELVIEGTQQTTGIAGCMLFPMSTRSQSVDQAAQAEREQLRERMAQMEEALAAQKKAEAMLVHEIKAEPASSSWSSELENSRRSQRLPPPSKLSRHQPTSCSLHCRSRAGSRSSPRRHPRRCQLKSAWRLLRSSMLKRSASS